MKTYKKDYQNILKSMKTAYDKRVVSKLEAADWQLKVMVPGTEPM